MCGCDLMKSEFVRAEAESEGTGVGSLFIYVFNVKWD